jgi:general secretion pathway protein K
MKVCYPLRFEWNSVCKTSGGDCHSYKFLFSLRGMIRFDWGALVRKSSKSYDGDAGYALLVVMWTVMTLSLLTAQINRDGRVASGIASGLRGAAELEADADGSIYISIFHMLDGDGDMWRRESGNFELKELNSVVHVNVEDDRGKFDLNYVAAGKLAALFNYLGVDKERALLLAGGVRRLRSRAYAPDQDAGFRSRARGDWTLPDLDIQRTDDIQDLPGMTADLYAAAAPFITIGLKQDPWLKYSGPIVVSALLNGIRNFNQTLSPTDDHGPVVMQLHAVAKGINGDQFQVDVRIRFGALSGTTIGYEILTWE